MCLNPIKIKNPNYQNRVSVKIDGRSVPYSHFKDCVSQYIYVPCGKCAECLHYRQSSFVQRCKIQSIDHYLFFCTLTYNPENLPILYYESEEFKYADRKDLQLFFKRLRNMDVFEGRSFKYVAVSEYGSIKHRPHFHVLFFVQKNPDDSEYTPINLETLYYSRVLDCWSKNVGTNRKPIYEPLLTLPKRRTSRKPYDFHYCQKRSGCYDDVVFYVSKYVLKFDSFYDRLDKYIKINYPDDYEDLIKFVKPCFLVSKHFGLPDTPEKWDIIKHSINISDDFPKFFDEISGFSSPLCRYFKKHCIDLQSQIRFTQQYDRDYNDNVIFYSDFKERAAVDSARRKFDSQKRSIESHLSY